MKKIGKITEKHVRCCITDDPMTKIEIDDRDLRGSRLIHRIFDESAKLYLKANVRLNLNTSVYSGVLRTWFEKQNTPLLHRQLTKPFISICRDNTYLQLPIKHILKHI